MSVNLSALISCDLSWEAVYHLPEFLNQIPNKDRHLHWNWYSVNADQPLGRENIETWVNEGLVWIEGQNNLSITPARTSLEIGFGWSYSRFFKPEKRISEFIEDICQISLAFNCPKPYFLSESTFQTLGYHEVALAIARGELSEADVSLRLSEVYGYDVYSKEQKDKILRL